MRSRETEKENETEHFFSAEKLFSLYNTHTHTFGYAMQKQNKTKQRKMVCSHVMHPIGLYHFVAHVMIKWIEK